MILLKLMIRHDTVIAAVEVADLNRRSLPFGRRANERESCLLFLLLEWNYSIVELGVSVEVLDSDEPQLKDVLLVKDCVDLVHQLVN